MLLTRNQYHHCGWQRNGICRWRAKIQLAPPKTMKSPKATEQRNPRTRGIDAKSTIEILRAIHREDASVAKAVLQRASRDCARRGRDCGRPSARRTALLRRRGNQRAPCGARRRGTSANIWHAAAHGPGRDRGRPPRAHARRRRRGRQSRARGERPGRARPESQGRRRGNRGQRRDALCPGGAGIRKAKRRGHDRRHVKSADADHTNGANQHRHADRTGGRSPARRG